ncbi:sigma 54-interacting transcriptional regulator [Limnoglobus roseus]|uniref:Sigma-54 dependendent transcription regulator n=1 Tax=Limnoglobus roseus TaxID=2598579 RepID=A0A5C1A7Z9_9BACT|nr:sigma 54-interacting transcriptional regulator [Limnoglobus roseus]QEL14367.1 sigma-54 dependendent transcription regulator [Limnoglobus roseus]
MRARLKVEAGEGSPTLFELAPGQPATLGRSRDSSVVLKDDLASRLHAKVYYEDGRWVVRDFGLNGTKVNGTKVSGAAELNDGSVIQIGDAVVRFHTVAGPAITPPPTGPRTNGLSHPLSGTKTGTDHRTPAPSESPHATKTGFNVDRFAGRLTDTEVAASQLKVDELTALCRFMTAAVETKDAHELIRLALRVIVNQTTAKVAGYLNLDPNDPTPRFILPDTAAVDSTLSRRLTERVRNERKTIWLFNDPTKGDVRPPTESLFAYHDALCLPLSTKGELYAAVHVYRTGSAFADRDARFIEAVSGYLGKSLELHRHRRKLEAENNRLRASVPTADELIGDSNAMMGLRQQIAKAAPLPFTVLIHGESGSGKELVAQALHRQSVRTAGPLVVVNCAAIAPTLLEAELFGYRKGAFSGADRDHPGLFEQADEGTLFLDEVGELSLDCQAKLLRVIEGKPFRPVGGTKDVKVDVRVVAATHRDLDKEVKAAKFRQDLLFRLKVIPLKVPPLREHAEDIPELAGFFLERLSVQCRKTFHLKPAAMRKLQAYTWPGNVRQLRAVLESTAVMCETDTIDAADLAITAITEAAPTNGSELPNSLSMDELETWAIRKALKQTSGNVSRASQILGMSRDTLHTKLKKKGIARDEATADAGDGA